MALEFFDHTADVGVRVTAASLDELFAEAALAFAITMTDPGKVGSAATRPVSLEAASLDQLLVDWLSELVGLFDIEQFLSQSADVTIRKVGAEWRLEATAFGEPYDPTRHILKVLVKGVTYHDLRIIQTPQGSWETSIIFDI